MTIRSVELADAVIQTADILKAHGVIVAEVDAVREAYKARDRREPGRRQKVKFEDKLYRAVLRMFRRQRRKLLDRLQAMYPARKAMSTWDIDNLLSGDWDADEDAAAEIARVLVAASQHGVDLFAGNITFDMDWTMVNTDAADWARRYTYDLVKKLNDTSRVALQKNISAFIDTPGMTIGDVTRLLPFDERRSLLIAVTEITRAYGESNQIAANSLAAEFPGVRVKKRWNTNNDSLVCLICGPLNQMVVDYDAEFAPGIMVPGDAHPGDRCWMTVFTDIEDTTPELDYSPASMPDAMQKQMNHPMYNVDKQERVFIYDDNGNVLFDKWGDKDGVDFKLDDRFKNGQLLHNHPPERMGPTIWDTDTLTFSKSDIELAHNQNVSRIVATGQKEVFIMERPPNGWGDFNESYLQTVKNLATNKEYADIVTNYRYELANIPMSEKNEMSKKLWREFAKVTNAIYKEIRK